MKNDVHIVPSLILICNQLIVVFPSYYTWSSRLRDVNNLYLRSKSQHTCDLDSGASNSEMLFVVHFPYFSWLTVIQLNFAFWILSFAIQTGVFKLYAWEFYGCRNNYRRFEGLKEPFSSVSQTFWKDRLFGTGDSGKDSLPFSLTWNHLCSYIVLFFTSRIYPSKLCFSLFHIAFVLLIVLLQWTLVILRLSD